MEDNGKLILWGTLVVILLIIGSSDISSDTAIM